MTHRHPTNLLEAYIDDDLSPAERTSVQETIAACPECRTAYEELRRLKEVLQHNQAPDPGAQYWQELDSLIQAKTSDRIPVTPRPKATPEDKRAFIRSVFSFAVALTLFVTAIALNRDKGESLAQTTGSNAPVFAVAPLRDVLLSMPDSVFTTEDEQHWADAIIMLGIPGCPGRMAGLRNLPPRSI